MVLAPLWPAYGEAIARGDVEWVRRTLRRSVTIAVSLSALVSAALVMLGPWLIHAWVGTAVLPSLLLLVGLAAWKTVEAGGSALAGPPGPGAGFFGSKPSRTFRGSTSSHFSKTPCPKSFRLA